MTKPKQPDGKILKYTEEALKKALDAVAEGMSYANAAKAYGVPKTTILYKFKGKYPVARQMGPATVLSKVEEKLLSDWILHMQRCGFPITKFHLLESVQRLLNDSKRQTVFKDNRPGRAWYSRFVQRNPEITERVYQSLARARSSVTEQQIRNWFDEVKTYMEEKEFLSVLDDATRIFNLDETAFFLSPDNGKVLAKKGSKTVYSFVQNDEKECLTALIGSNAAGTFVPPMVVFPYIRLPERIATSAPNEWGIGRSESGWMTGELFFEYIANIFQPWLLKNKMKLPIILFIDGHTSHLTLALSDFCSENDIILVALYPNATHILQPMDVGLFHALKVYWRRRVFEFRLKKNERIKRENFCELLEDVLKSIKSEILQNAFETCGLYPFNANAIKYEKTIKNTNLKEKDEQQSVPLNEHVKDVAGKIDSYVFFSQYIQDEKLQKFVVSGEAWDGPLEDKSLFEVWQKMCTDLNIVHERSMLVPICLNANEIIVDLDELAGEDVQIDYSSAGSCDDSDTQVLGDEQMADRIADSEYEHSDTDDEREHFDSEDEDIEFRSEIPDATIPKDPLPIQAISNDSGGRMLNTPPPMNENIVEKDIPPHIPSPLKKNLLWPNKTDAVKSEGGRKPKEKIPAVTVSVQWKKYFKKKEEDTMYKELKKQQRKVSLNLKNLEKAKKAEETQKKKAERLVKTAEANKIKAERKMRAEAKKIEKERKAADKEAKKSRKRNPDESENRNKRRKTSPNEVE